MSDSGLLSRFSTIYNYFQKYLIYLLVRWHVLKMTGPWLVLDWSLNYAVVFLVKISSELLPFSKGKLTFAL
jgi:hypothetical protein